MKMVASCLFWLLLYISPRGYYAGGFCSNGFPDRVEFETVSRGITTRLIPEMRFTCTGTIVGYSVSLTIPNQGDYSPEIQLWRENSSQPGVYYKKQDAIVINTTACNAVYSNNNNMVFNCSLNQSAQIPVQAGDILGLELPASDTNRGMLSTRSGSAPTNYVFEQPPLSSPVLLSSSSSLVYELPQIAFEIDSESDVTKCASGFPDIPASVVSCCTNNGDLVTILIPEMNFSCNATIFGFIVAGTDLYMPPHSLIQIWRKNMSESLGYYKVGSNIEINTMPRARGGVCSYRNRVVMNRVVWCILNDGLQVSVQPGDILGLELHNSDIHFMTGVFKNYIFEGQLQSNIALLNDTNVTITQQIPQIAFNLTSDECTSGFPKNITTEGAGRDTNSSVITRLIPSMRFGCKGSLVRLNVAVALHGNGLQDTKIQIWRENSTLPGVYYKPYLDIPLTSDYTVCVDASRPSNTPSIFTCILTECASVSVEPGDILGLELPPTDETDFEILFKHGMVENYVFRGKLSSKVNLSEMEEVTSDQPQIDLLVALEDATACPVHTSSTDPPTIFTTVTSTTASNLKFLLIAVTSIPLAVIVVLGVVLVIKWRKRKHSIPNSNGITMEQLEHNHQITQNAQCVTVTVNPSSVPYQAFPVKAEQEQAHDYYEISDHYETAKTASTTVDHLIPSSDSHKYCCTPQPSDCEYELPKDCVSGQGSTSTLPKENFTFWEPATTVNELYKEMSSKKYREITQKQLEITQVLGSGQFGEVSRGVWQSPMGAMDVAVKQLQSGASEEEKVKFLQEAAINGQFRHPNVVQLMGVVTVGEPTMIVLELLSNGNLTNYLAQLKPLYKEDHPNLPHLLLKFCQQVAAGMEYLARKAFVHRDLAARNILVGEDKTCKISDFGMSRDLMDENYYVSHGGKIPVKWTAPEALQYRKYSTASDVWSFGCVMYEIWSLGHKPFEMQSNAEAIRMVDKGYRLPPPPGLPKELYKIMIQCWNREYSRRPTFPQLVELLSRTDFELFVWEEEDLIGSDPQVKVIGAPLDVAKNLYPELQRSYLKKNEVITDADSHASRDYLESVASPSDSTAYLLQDIGYQSYEGNKGTFHFSDSMQVDGLQHIKISTSASVGNEKEKITGIALTCKDDLLPPQNYSQLVFTDSSKERPLPHPVPTVQQETESELLTVTYDIPEKLETGYSFLTRPSQPLPHSRSITFPLTAKSHENNHLTSHHKSMKSIPLTLEGVCYTSNTYEQVQSYKTMRQFSILPPESHQNPTAKQPPSSPHSDSPACYDRTNANSVFNDGDVHYEKIQSYEQVQCYQKVLHSDLTQEDLQSLGILPLSVHAHSRTQSSHVSLEQPSYEQIQTYEKVKNTDLDEKMFLYSRAASCPYLASYDHR